MEICTLTSTPETTLLSNAVRLPVTAKPCPPTASLRLADAPLTGDATAWRGRPDADGDRGVAFAAALRGGAMAGLGFAFVADQMVIDHKYTTRLGSSFCSPPV
jgi:hypothetical protein